MRFLSKITMPKKVLCSYIIIGLKIRIELCSVLFRFHRIYMVTYEEVSLNKLKHIKYFTLGHMFMIASGTCL